MHLVAQRSKGCLRGYFLNDAMSTARTDVARRSHRVEIYKENAAEFLGNMCIMHATGLGDSSSTPHP